MSGKKLDENNIINELKSSSLFFQQRKESPVSDVSQNAAPTAPVGAPAIPQTAQMASHTAPQVPATQDAFQSATPSRDDEPNGTDSSNPPPQVPVPSAISPSIKTTERPIVRQRTMVGSEERLNGRSNERTKVRHSFDILSDQLFALRELAVERERLFGRKVLLGDLVQEALDLFISKARNQE